MPMAHLPTCPVLTHFRTQPDKPARVNRSIILKYTQSLHSPISTAAPMDLRVVVCQDCDGEGRRWRTHFSHWDPPEDVDAGPCATCEGTGYEVVEVEPLTEDEFMGREWRPIEGVEDADA